MITRQVLLGQQASQIYEYEQAEQVRLKRLSDEQMECMEALKTENDFLKANIAKAKAASDLAIAELKFKYQDVVKAFENYKRIEKSMQNHIKVLEQRSLDNDKNLMIIKDLR